MLWLSAHTFWWNQMHKTLIICSGGWGIRYLNRTRRLWIFTRGWLVFVASSLMGWWMEAFLSWCGKWNGWQVGMGMKGRSSSFMNKCKHNILQLLQLVSSIQPREGANLQRHLRRSNENVRVTGAFNCIYAIATSEDCRGLSRMKA